ncbi:MAG TPA: DUF1028 domain-containing protein [Phycisphaerae bacterium]|jgi:uncharacterized Ntn-hydrolase superfamily protein
MNAQRLMVLGFGTAAMLVGSAPSRATWSIVLVDSQTKEVAIASVTCLNNFDLLALTPVTLVGIGAGVVQAAGDFDGIRRPIIHDQLLMGTPPAQILTILAQVPGHQQRQYGIVNAVGQAVTFTGTQNGQWAGGVTGNIGTLYYAVQGNVLAGGCVVSAAVSALQNTSGDVPAKLMAGMQAARMAGGDGRCSCSPNNPAGCGCPPPAFVKSGHIGYMVTARIGDTDDPICNVNGCSDGLYFMKFDVAFQPSSAPDPVVQLQNLFDAWRANLVGRPDAIQSTAVFDVASLPPNGTATANLTVVLRDWQGLPISVPIQSVAYGHGPGTAGSSTIGPLVDLGGGMYSITITAGTIIGTDHFRITVNDGIRPVTLMPDPILNIRFGDFGGDGDVDLTEYATFAACLSGPTATVSDDCSAADLDGDADADLKECAAFGVSFTGAP